MDKNDSTPNDLPFEDNAQPPPYNQIQSIIPQPYLPPTQIALPTQPILNNNHTYLARSGVPLSSFGDITEVVYGQKQDEQNSSCCCCSDVYLYIPDNYTLNLNEHRIVGIVCPRCNVGVIKLGFVKDGCDEKRIHVCLHCRTVFPGSSF